MTTRWAALLLMAGFVVTGCAQTTAVTHMAKQIPVERLELDPELVALGNLRHPHRGGHYKVGRPYVIKGRRYVPEVDYNYSEIGIASWYGPGFNGRLTANGEVYDEDLLTAAHRTLPMPSFVRVTNLENGRSLVVRVNDRGPFADNRIIDMSRRGAELLGFQRQGLAKVRVDILAEQSQAIAAALKGDRPVTPAQPKGIAPVITADAVPLPGRKPGLMPQERAVAVNAPTPVPRPQQDIETAVQSIVTAAGTSAAAYYIQIGAFRDLNNAEQVKARLTSLASADVAPLAVNEAVLHRVRVGPVGDRNTADDLLLRLIDAGFLEARIMVD